MQTRYEKFEMTVIRGHGSLLLTIPYLLCRREEIKAGDKVILFRPEGTDFYLFYKEDDPKALKLPDD